MEVHFLLRFPCARSPSSLLGRMPTSPQITSILGSRQRGWGDVIGRQSWFSSHNLDSALAAKMRTYVCRPSPWAWTQAMTQQHLLTRSRILHMIENLPRPPKVRKPMEKRDGILRESSLQRARVQATKAFAGARIRREETPAIISVVSSVTIFLEPLPITLGRVFWRTHTYAPQLLLCRNKVNATLFSLTKTSHKA